MATGRIPDPNTAPLTAKGDLYTYSTVPARLAVGSNGDTLVADSAATTGLRWQAHTEAGKNLIINGAFDIWQRGTSFTYTTPSVPYTADRFTITNSGGSGSVNATLSRQSSGLTGFEYCARFQRTSGNTATTTLYMAQDVESSNSIPFAGKTVVVSFYARAGANYSATSSAFNLGLYSGTGTNQNINLSGYTGQATVGSVTATLTTSWQRFSFSGTVSSSATQLGIQSTFTPTGTAGANDYYEITGLQVELGAVPTNFSRAGGTIQGELACAQRYYYKGDTDVTFSGNVTSGTNYYAFYSLPVTMRVSPTITLTSANGFGFANTAGTAYVTTTWFREVRAANNTISGGYFGSTFTASAEL